MRTLWPRTKPDYLLATTPPSDSEDLLALALRWQDLDVPASYRTISWLGACGGSADPELFFDTTSPERQQQAKRICAPCPVRETCLLVALATTPNPDGIWGGVGKETRSRLRTRLRHLLGVRGGARPPVWRAWWSKGDGLYNHLDIRRTPC
jgi:hypothetical protein